VRVFCHRAASKEQAITLPVLATLFEYFYREDRERTSARQKLSRYVPLWATVALYLAVRGILLGGVASIAARPGLSWYEIGLSAISLIGLTFGNSCGLCCFPHFMYFIRAAIC